MASQTWGTTESLLGTSGRLAEVIGNFFLFQPQRASKYYKPNTWAAQRFGLTPGRFLLLFSLLIFFPSLFTFFAVPSCAYRFSPAYPINSFLLTLSALFSSWSKLYNIPLSLSLKICAFHKSICIELFIVTIKSPFV